MLSDRPRSSLLAGLARCASSGVRRSLLGDSPTCGHQGRAGRDHRDDPPCQPLDARAPGASGSRHIRRTGGIPGNGLLYDATSRHSHVRQHSDEYVQHAYGLADGARCTCRARLVRGSPGTSRGLGREAFGHTLYRTRPENNFTASARSKPSTHSVFGLTQTSGLYQVMCFDRQKHSTVRSSALAIRSSYVCAAPRTSGAARPHKPVFSEK